MYTDGVAQAVALVNVEIFKILSRGGEGKCKGAPQFSQVQLSPKTVSGWVDISKKLSIQSDPSVEQIIRNYLGRETVTDGGQNE